MRYGIVNVSCADLLRRPDHKSETVTQGLLGAPVRISRSAAGGEWLCITLPDGYPGWTKAGHVAQMPRRDALAWKTRPLALVKVASAEVLSERRRGSLRVRGLTLGCRLKTGQTLGRWVRVTLPGGTRGWVKRDTLLPAGKTLPPEGRKILETARLFLGAPYLWGGVTPRGTDCSGLVQTAFALHGIELPRDVADQWRCGRPVEGRLRPGDLLFFGPRGRPLTHVAIWAGGRRFLHAGCPVEEASLDPGHARYRPKLKAQYRFARRVLEEWS